MIKHLILDVDGVLNTGHFLYSKDGKQFKMFGPHDKDGLNLAKRLGLTINFTTADSTGFTITKSRIVNDWKFNESQLHLIPEGSRLKWIVDSGFDLNEVAYIGDGIHDVAILKRVGLGIAPISARKEAKEVAAYVTESPAGSGAVLDACLYIEKQLTGRNSYDI